MKSSSSSSSSLRLHGLCRLVLFGSHLFVHLYCFPWISVAVSSSSSSSSSSSTSTSSSKNHPRHFASSTVLDVKSKSFTSSSSSSLPLNQKLQLIQVQIIHRHGDRTPITPMLDTEYWHGTLPSPSLVSKLSQGTTVIYPSTNSSEENVVVSHAAGGIGPFGKLTTLGLLQMVQLGSRIRDELHLEEDADIDGNVDGDGNAIRTTAVNEQQQGHGKLFTHSDPVHPSKVKIYSTNFPRTIQSVQALLMGLFPLGYDDGEIVIDATHTDILIPDPQPRLSVEQVELERELSQREHIVAREEELMELAEKITNDLHHLIDWQNAKGASWGIGEEKRKNGRQDDDGKNMSLTFSQLSEVMTCLKVRDMLPESISQDDFKIITSHAAWKWFENMRNHNLARLAMKSFMNFIMETLCDGMDENRNNNPVLYIYSCHDSSLIGLMCAFRLEQPAEWPEYGSYLKVELFKAEEERDGESVVDYYVRFSLNGNVLKSSWGFTEEESSNQEPREMICLRHLSQSIAQEHGHPCILSVRETKNSSYRSK